MNRHGPPKDRWVPRRLARALPSDSGPGPSCDGYDYGQRREGAGAAAEDQWTLVESGQSRSIPAFERRNLLGARFQTRRLPVLSPPSLPAQPRRIASPVDDEAGSGGGVGPAKPDLRNRQPRALVLLCLQRNEA